MNCNSTSLRDFFSVFAHNRPEFANPFDICSEVVVPYCPQRQQNWEIGVSSVTLLLKEDFTPPPPIDPIDIPPTPVYLSCNFSKSILEKESGAITSEEVPLVSFIVEKEVGIISQTNLSFTPVHVPISEHGIKKLKFTLRTLDKKPIKCVNPELIVLAHLRAKH